MSVSVQAAPRRAGSGWRVFGAGFAVLVIVAGVLSAASWLARQTETQDQTYTQQVDRVVIDVGTGDISIGPGDRGVAVHRRLVWSWSKPRITETWQGQTLRIATRCPAVSLGPGCGVDYTLRVPPDVTVVARSTTGDVAIQGVRGDLTLSTSTGDIKVTDAVGALSAATSTGNVDATGILSSRVHARAATGDVSLRFSRQPDEVVATTNTGDVRVVVPAGGTYKVQASTGTGRATVGIAQDPASPRAITARAGTGDIHVTHD